MIPLLALIGADGLYLLFAWLLSAIAASWLSDAPGYGEKLGLATGLLLTVVGAIIWLVIPVTSELLLRRGPGRTAGPSEGIRARPGRSVSRGLSAAPRRAPGGGTRSRAPARAGAARAGPR